MTNFRSAAQRVLKAWDDMQKTTHKIPLVDGTRGNLHLALADLRLALQQPMQHGWHDAEERPEDSRPFLARTLIFTRDVEEKGYAALVIVNGNDLYYADAGFDEEYGWNWDDGPVTAWRYLDARSGSALAQPQEQSSSIPHSGTGAEEVPARQCKPTAMNGRGTSEPDERNPDRQPEPSSRLANCGERGDSPCNTAGGGSGAAKPPIPDAEPEADRDIRAVEEFFAAHCLGHPDCTLPHRALDRIIDRLRAHPPAVTQPKERCAEIGLRYFGIGGHCFDATSGHLLHEPRACGEHDMCCYATNHVRVLLASSSAVAPKEKP